MAALLVGHLRIILPNLWVLFSEKVVNEFSVQCLEIINSANFFDAISDIDMEMDTQMQRKNPVR